MRGRLEPRQHGATHCSIVRANALRGCALTIPPCFVMCMLYWSSDNCIQMTNATFELRRCNNPHAMTNDRRGTGGIVLMIMRHEPLFLGLLQRFIPSMVGLFLLQPPGFGCLLSQLSCEGIL